MKKRFCPAKMVRVVAGTPLRAQPECRYLTGCGGLPVPAHGDYAEQLRVKHKHDMPTCSNASGRFHVE